MCYNDAMLFVLCYKLIQCPLETVIQSHPGRMIMSLPPKGVSIIVYWRLTIPDRFGRSDLSDGLCSTVEQLFRTAYCLISI